MPIVRLCVLLTFLLWSVVLFNILLKPSSWTNQFHILWEGNSHIFPKRILLLQRNGNIAVLFSYLCPCPMRRHRPCSPSIHQALDCSSSWPIRNTSSVPMISLSIRWCWWLTWWGDARVRATWSKLAVKLGEVCQDWKPVRDLGCDNICGQTWEKLSKVNI